MDPRKLTADYSVSPQIMPEDIPDIAQAGYRAVMCNRPDGEEFGQPDYNEVAQAAAGAGLEIRWVPIEIGRLTPVDLQAFNDALAEMPAPLLAYCRSGTRCAMMWAIAQHGRLSDDDILKATSDAGYDMAGLVRQLNNQA